MRKLIAAVVALTVISAAAAPSYAFDAKTFWDQHQQNQNG